MVSQTNTIFETQTNKMPMVRYAPVGVLRACVKAGVFASITTLTANNVAIASDTLSTGVSELTDTHKLNVNSEVTIDEVDTQSNHLFSDCSQIGIEAARLACYDRVAETGRRPNLIKTKRQIDLGKTIKSTFEGKPQFVMNKPKQRFISIVEDNVDDIEVIKVNNMTKTVKPTEENMALIRKFYNTGRYNKQKTLNANQIGSSHVIEQTQKNNYFLNTEVVRKFYQTTEDDVSKHAGDQTKYAEQNLLKNIDATGHERYHMGSLFYRKGGGITASNYSPLSLAYDLDANDDVGTWKPRPHNPMYILPLFLHDKPNRSPSTPSQNKVEYSQNDYRSPELKFQMSFKSKLAQDLFDTDADLWLGYTQQSHWQVYNEDNSRSFRAHNYEPELFLTQPVTADLPFDGKLRMLGGGLVHQSNGEKDPLSRSWNRAYLMGGAEWGNLTVVPRVWSRLSSDSVNKKNENPDIEDYMGYGDIKVYYDLDKGKSVAGTFRLNPSTGHGAAQIDYIHPMDNNVNLYMNLFHGYGESLVDYNHEDTAVGIGVMLNDWRGL